MLNRGDRKLSGDEMPYRPPSYIDFVHRKITCHYFQPSPNQFQVWADTGISSPVCLGPPPLNKSKATYFDIDEKGEEVLVGRC